jgi:hypothetical protein
MKHLQETHEHIRNEYENISAGITNILTGPVQVTLPAPITLPGLPNPMMPPPPPCYESLIMYLRSTIVDNYCILEE